MKKKIVLIGVIIISIILTVCVAYFALKGTEKSRINNTKSSIEEKFDESFERNDNVEKLEVEIADDSNEGKYFNADFGIEFKNPSSINVSYEYMVSNTYQIEVGGNIPNIIIRKFDSENLSLKSWVKTNISDESTLSIFNDQEAYFVKAKGLYPHEYEVYYVSQGRWIYSVSISKTLGCTNNTKNQVVCNDESDELYGEIIRSMEFIPTDYLYSAPMDLY